MTLPTKTQPAMLNDMATAWADGVGIIPALSKGMDFLRCLRR